MEIFKNRFDAGVQLAEKLLAYEKSQNTKVLALARGGVPVGYEIARILQLPLDVFLVRKLGVPGYEELAFGAITDNEKPIFNQEIIKSYNIKTSRIKEIVKKEYEELTRRKILYRDAHAKLSVFQQTIILVDDGIATGVTMLAAITALKEMHPKIIIAAAPVAALDAYARIIRSVNKLICIEKPMPFYSVGYWYHDFDQISDEEVTALLKKSNVSHYFK